MGLTSRTGLVLKEEEEAACLQSGGSRELGPASPKRRPTGHAEFIAQRNLNWNFGCRIWDSIIVSRDELPAPHEGLVDDLGDRL
jgi:hypothetical protein